MTPPLPAAPEGVAASSLDWMAATGHGRLHLYERPVMAERAEPVVVGQRRSRRPQRHRRYCFPAAVVAELPDASVIGTCGAVLTSDGCVLADQIASFDRAMAGHRVWQSHDGGGVLRLGGTAAVVAASSSGDPLRHFLTDTLPRIQLVRDAGLEPDHWIVTGTSESWQRQGIEAAGIDPDAVRLARWDRPLRAERLIVPSRPGLAQATAPWARVRLRSLLGAANRRGSRRLLLSSNASEEHRLRNEADLATVLDEFGFTTVVLEHLRFEEQVTLIGEAGCIVATHGAALSHLLHAPAGGTLIEISPATVLKPDYAAIADLAGWHHRFVPADVVDPPDDLDATIEHLTVEPGAVLDSLAALLPGMRTGPARARTHPPSGSASRGPAAHQPTTRAPEGTAHVQRQP